MIVLCKYLEFTSQYRISDYPDNQLVIKNLVKKCAKIEKKTLFFDPFLGHFLPQNMLEKNVDLSLFFFVFSS